jgi:peptidyl-prolyl cis-trans isomerase SurA
MRKQVFIGTALLSILLCTGTINGANGSAVVDRVVAVVNGEIITLSDVQREEALKKTEGKQDQRQLLEDMIDRKLQMSAAKRAGMDVTDKELSDAVAEIMKRNSLDEKQFEAALAKEGITLEQYKNELWEQMTLSRTFNKFVRSGVTVNDAEAREYYDRNQQNYSLPEQIRVRQIFFSLPDKPTPSQTAAVREKAVTALARAGKGENFTALVRELSESPDAASGGDLGFVQRDQAVQEIQDATSNLKPGDIAGPVQFGGGFNVFKLEEIRRPVKPFEKVKDEISKMLYEQKMENTYRTWLQSLRSDSNIENKL